jgi:hypothetical protein
MNENEVPVHVTGCDGVDSRLEANEMRDRILALEVENTQLRAMIACLHAQVSSLGVHRVTAEIERDEVRETLLANEGQFTGQVAAGGPVKRPRRRVSRRQTPCWVS